MSQKTITQARAILNFYKGLTPSFSMPSGIEIMNPFLDLKAWRLATAFYEKFYSDTNPRRYIFGINPGRFGAGVTGVPFTDPIRLQEKCGIPNDLKKLPELSSQFIYTMIDAYGGVMDFYGDYFITALFPLAFTWNNKNLNYYDDKELLRSSEPFIVQCIRQQLANIPTNTDECYCLGEGENYKQFRRINDKHGFFKNIIPLSHPRWVMQYRRKKMDEYAALYVEKLKEF
jgi:hypothetical protein